MAKHIINSPIIKGKDAAKFSELFLSKSVPNSDKKLQHKKDIELFLTTKVKEV